MPHYFDSNPETVHQPKSLPVRVGGVNLTFHTDSGVFSRSQLDFGTSLLIETVLEDVRKDGSSMHGRLLDLGCGYGPVGIAFKRLFPPLSVVMVDINSRAVALAQQNAAENQVRYPDIRQGDGFSVIKPDEQFDYVLTNPPIRAGKQTVYAFFEGAWQHLKPGGVLYVVIQKKQGASSSQAKLAELFGNCDMIGKESGYRILKAIRTEGPISRETDQVGGKYSFKG